MLWKEHYRAAWPWDIRSLTTAGWPEAPATSSGGDRGDGGDEKSRAGGRWDAALEQEPPREVPEAAHSPHPCGGTNFRKRKELEPTRSAERKEKRGRMQPQVGEADAEEGKKPPETHMRLGEESDDKMEVTVSPYLAIAMEKNSPSLRAQDLFTSFFASVSGEKQKKASMSGMSSAHEVVCFSSLVQLVHQKPLSG